MVERKTILTYGAFSSLVILFNTPNWCWGNEIMKHGSKPRQRSFAPWLKERQEWRKQFQHKMIVG